ncbi:hypothetical protein BVG79_01342 [Ketogulonicigenium robustum]|uniref:Uncharacterized protein n=1 Tax=Ketogulonicigenium robustum TaxID=92947 RepID=A0A1W6NZK6_9RHOB|nr:hypothetical protein [Ketogulonicigenium robustum]ARO14688.1 hypothetical protein BVG79_01342 [Ketogulonicigenium robustum]
MSDSVPQQGDNLQQVSQGQSQAAISPNQSQRARPSASTQMGAGSTDDSYPPRFIFRDLASI